MATTQLNQASFDPRRGLRRATARTAGAVLEAVHAGFEVAAPPLVGSLSRDAHRLGRAGDRPTLFDHLAEPQSTLRSQRSVTVHLEPPWPCGCVSSTTMP